MALPNLLQDGDAIERATWPFMWDFFPHYEEFWQVHLVPLRSAGSIHPRRGIDEDFEFLAMKHYSLYVILAKAYERILGTGGEPLRALAFPDDLYGMLHRVAELAIDVVDKFEKIFHDCLKKKVSVNTLQITKLMDRIDGYRNLIHQEILAVQGDASGRILVPRPEKLEEYSKWTDVLYHPQPQDFVDVHKQLINDFCALCSALETTWRELCGLSKQLSEDKLYLQKRAQGESVPVVSFAAPPASGTFMVSSHAVSNAVASPVAGVIMIRKPGG